MRTVQRGLHERHPRATIVGARADSTDLVREVGAVPPAHAVSGERRPVRPVCHRAATRCATSCRSPWSRLARWAMPTGATGRRHAAADGAVRRARPFTGVEAAGRVGYVVEDGRPGVPAPFRQGGAPGPVSPVSTEGQRALRRWDHQSARERGRGPGHEGGAGPGAVQAGGRSARHPGLGPDVSCPDRGRHRQADRALIGVPVERRDHGRFTCRRADTSCARCPPTRAARSRCPGRGPHRCAKAPSAPAGVRRTGPRPGRGQGGAHDHGPARRLR